MHLKLLRSHTLAHKVEQCIHYIIIIPAIRSPSPRSPHTLHHPLPLHQPSSATYLGRVHIIPQWPCPTYWKYLNNEYTNTIYFLVKI